MPLRLLIIEHQSPLGKALLPNWDGQMQCERRTWETFSTDELPHSPAQVVIVDAGPTSTEAIWFFHWLRQNPIRASVLAILPQLPEPDVLQTISEVADDFVIGPLREQELKLRIARITGPESAQADEIQQRLTAKLGFAKLVGRHASFVRAAEQAVLFAESDAAVLITGETGTGKELFAHAIHSFSGRHRGPFIPVDCGALPEHLAENELFGHCRGAFTDARADQKGLAAMADGGTLFLDEVDALSLANQAKLLRFLQEGTYRALGADHFTRGNIRIVAATNRNLEEQIRLKQFRSDLYFRLDVLRLQLAALRERIGDVCILARHFLENECAAAKCERKAFSSGALRKLELYHWPGNIRELLNTVRRAFLACGGRQVLPEHILLRGQSGLHEKPDSSPGSFRSAKHSAIEQFECAYVEELMVRHRGNITQAAHEAGKDRRAFGRLVKKYRASRQIAS